MTFRKSVPFLLLAAALPLLTACPPPPPGRIYVRTGPPPAVQAEVIGTAPGPEFIWVPGYHRWEEGRYVWVAGRWDRPPHARAKWVAGRWKHDHNGWFWIEGRWR